MTLHLAPCITISIERRSWRIQQHQASASLSNSAEPVASSSNSTISAQASQQVSLTNWKRFYEQYPVVKAEQIQKLPAELRADIAQEQNINYGKVLFHLLVSGQFIEKPSDSDSKKAKNAVAAYINTLPREEQIKYKTMAVEKDKKTPLSKFFYHQRDFLGKIFKSETDHISEFKKYLKKAEEPEAAPSRPGFGRSGE